MNARGVIFQHQLGDDAFQEFPRGIRRRVEIEPPVPCCEVPLSELAVFVPRTERGIAGLLRHDLAGLQPERIDPCVQRDLLFCADIGENLHPVVLAGGRQGRVVDGRINAFPERADMHEYRIDAEPGELLQIAADMFPADRLVRIGEQGTDAEIRDPCSDDLFRLRCGDRDSLCGFFGGRRGQGRRRGAGGEQQRQTEQQGTDARHKHASFPV